MSREFVAADLAAFFLVVLLAGAAAGTPGYAVGWTMIAPTQVPLGQTIPVGVIGPANASFDLALYTQPFNTSAPIFDYGFQLPNNASGVGKLNLSIPTSTLTLGTYNLVLSSAGANLSTKLVTMENPVNITQIEENMTYIFGELAALGARTTYQGEEIDTLLGNVAQLRWAVVFEAFILVTYIPISEWSRRNPGAASSIPEWWAKRFEREPELSRWGEGQPGTFAVSRDGTAVEDTGMDVTSMRLFDPNRVSVGKASCSYCSVPKSEAEQVAHLKAGAPSGHGIPEPKKGRDYWDDAKELERQRQVLRPAVPEKKHRGTQRWRVDLGKVN